MRLWTTEIAHSPFTAAPLIADVDADGQLDIVAAPLSEAQTVVSAETGKTLLNTKWPTQKLDSSVFSGPLQVPNPKICTLKNIAIINLNFEQFGLITYEPGHEKMCLIPYVNNKGADQPAHPRSLIRTFVVHCLGSIVSILAKSKISRL